MQMSRIMALASLDIYDDRVKINLFNFKLANF